MRNEPIVEITQVKGTSDTHPVLLPMMNGQILKSCHTKLLLKVFQSRRGLCSRCLVEGIKMEQAKGFNPYKFGLIGSSDTHTAASSQEEDNFFSKIGLLDSSAALRGSIPVTDPAMLASSVF